MTDTTQTTPREEWAGMSKRFSKKVAEGTGCWNWIGASTESGYGTMLGLNKKVEYAHRIAYQLFSGPIPDGYEVDHLCKNIKCVNPLHLEPVTRVENNRRSNSASALNARKTHCKNGHAFTPENTYMRADRNQKECLTCRKLANDKRYGRL